MTLKVWREVSADKPLLRGLIRFIPRRLNAVIRKEGDQLQKADYQKEE